MNDIVIQIITTISNFLLTLLALVVSINSLEVSKRQHKLEEMQQIPILYSNCIKYGKKSISVLNSEVSYGELNDSEKECFTIEVKNIGTAIINAVEIEEMLIKQGATKEEIESNGDNIVYPAEGISVLQNDSIKSFILTGKENNAVSINFVLDTNFHTIQEIDNLYVFLKLNLHTINSVAAVYSQYLEMWCEIEKVVEKNIRYRVCKVICG